MCGCTGCWLVIVSHFGLSVFHGEAQFYRKIRCRVRLNFQSQFTFRITYLLLASQDWPVNPGSNTSIETGFERLSEVESMKGGVEMMDAWKWWWHGTVDDIKIVRWCEWWTNQNRSHGSRSHWTKIKWQVDDSSALPRCRLSFGNWGSRMIELWLTKASRGNCSESHDT